MEQVTIQTNGWTKVYETSLRGVDALCEKVLELFSDKGARCNLYINGRLHIGLLPSIATKFI